MNKYAFNHDATNKIHEALGIPGERMDQMIKDVRVAFIEAESPVHHMEISINKIQPKTEVEAMLVGWLVARVCEFEGQRNPLSSLARMLADMGK